MAKKASPKPADVLADQLLRVLAAQRSLGPESYPLTAQRLVELTDPQAPAAVVKQAFNKAAFRKGAVRANAKERDAPVALADDLERLAASPLLLDFLLRAAAKPATRAFTPAGLKKNAIEKLKKPFQDALGRHSAAGTLPPTVGWVLVGGRRNFFLLRDLHVGGQAAPPAADGPARRETPSVAAPPASPGEFAAAFDAAFTHLDRAAHGDNFVSLVALRKALPFPRPVFDAGLQQLRRQDRYSLSAAEGRHGITAEEQAAGIPEEDSLLLFVSRSKP